MRYSFACLLLLSACLSSAQCDTFSYADPTFGVADVLVICDSSFSYVHQEGLMPFNSRGKVQRTRDGFILNSDSRFQGIKMEMGTDSLIGDDKLLVAFNDVPSKYRFSICLVYGKLDTLRRRLDVKYLRDSANWLIDDYDHSAFCHIDLRPLGNRKPRYLEIELYGMFYVYELGPYTMRLRLDDDAINTVVFDGNSLRGIEDDVLFEDQEVIIEGNGVVLLNPKGRRVRRHIVVHTNRGWKMPRWKRVLFLKKADG